MWHANWRQNGAMPSIQIKNVPAETHEILRRRAAAQHQSLQEYLLKRLVEESRMPTNEELFDRIEAERSGGHVPFEEVVQAVREDRDGR